MNFLHISDLHLGLRLYEASLIDDQRYILEEIKKICEENNNKKELFRKQEKIDLSFIEFEILHLLMRSPGRVFSKEQIYDIIWNEPYSGDYNVVMRHICNIREKIEDDPGHPVYIQTVRGVGYRFNGNLGSE